MVNKNPLEPRLRRYLAEREGSRSPVGLEERIVRAVKEQPSRPQASSWSSSWSWPRQLIAAALIAALGIGIAAGVIYLRQLSGAAPAGPKGLTPAEQTELAALEARPLVPLPSLAPDRSCPVTPSTLIEPYRAGLDRTVSANGTGPVYGTSYTEIHEQSGDYYEVTIFTDPSVRGVVLIRSRQIGSTKPVFSFGQYAVGRTLGRESVAEQQVVFRSEQVLPAAHPPANPDAAPGWGIWQVWQGMAPGGSRCSLVQIDTAAGTQVTIAAPGR